MSSTTQSTPPSRAALAQMAQGFTVSRLWQDGHSSMTAAALPSIWESGSISVSRFFKRCSATRRAERGPRPGSLEMSFIRCSISVPIMG